MISIIIPVFNEADTIGKLLSHLIKNSSLKNISEIIVVDGGSTDGTQEIITSFMDTERSRSVLNKPQTLIEGFSTPLKAQFESNLILINSPKGRAKQMNTGVRQATGSILYFLHADCLPPKDFDQLIINEVEKGNSAGCFKMKFDHDHWWLRLASWLTHFNWRACRGGDQSQFITKLLFNEIGGYDEDYIIYEDNILINELFKRNQFVVIQEWILTSARLYERVGIWTLQYHFWTIYVKRWFGASANDIHTYYKKYIAG
jgi:rSAM/selenodomain-associated transferase 2